MTTSASAAASASASSFCLPCPGSERSLSRITRDLAQLWPLHAQARWLGPPSCSGRLRAPSRPLRPRAARWAARRGQADSSPMGSSVGGSWAAGWGGPTAAPLRPVLTVPTHTARPTGAVLADPASVTAASNHPWWQNCCVLLLTERTAFASKSCAVLTAMPNQQPNQKPNQNPYPEPNPEPYQNPYPEPNPKALLDVQPHVQPNALPRA